MSGLEFSGLTILFIFKINDGESNSVEPQESDCSCVHKDYITHSEDEGQVMKTFSHEARVQFQRFHSQNSETRKK